MEAIKHQQTEVDTLLVTIDEKQYDLAKWQRYHPGGKLILQQYIDKDATDAFHAFHDESSFAKLDTMKHTKVDVVVDDATAEYRQMRLDFQEAGLFQTNWYWSTYKILSTYALFITAFVLVIKFDLWLLASIFLGVGYQQAGWLGHDFCHHNVFKNRKVGNFFAYITGNVLSGFSVNWWKDRHNTHHAITNVLEADPDIDNLPLFSWTVKELDRLENFPIVAYLIPYQHYYFPIFTPFLKLIWCLQSVFWLNDETTQNKSYFKSNKAEKATLVLHWIFVAIFLYHVPNSYKLLAFAISEGIGGAGIALVVFMNHYACEKILEEENQFSFVELQLNTTKNMNPGIIVDWLCGGLNYQIEHHLFPTIPRHNLSTLRPIVQAYCKKYDLPYQTDSFVGCFTAVESQLKQVAEAFTKMKKE